MKVSPNLSSYQEYYNKINNKVVDIVNIPLIVICGLIIMFYILFFSSLGSGTKSSPNPYNVGSVSTKVSSGGFGIFSSLIVIILVFLILIGGFKYLFKIDVWVELKNIFTSEPELDINVNTPKGKHSEPNASASDVEYPIFASPEVFHISDNKYNYDDARAVCKAFNSRLATYDEVEHAYNKGGEWCSYGWSNKGLALFPTQKDTYNKLQQVRGHENDCGRPGVNGGYIEDKYKQFGANCYGVKPEITKLEKKLMKTYNVIPPSKTQKKIDNKAKKYGNELNKILITPFSEEKWHV
jgi:hypothetical protein